MQIRKLCYIAPASRIPSRYTPGFQIVKMCSAFAEEIEYVELIIPPNYRNLWATKRDIYEFYSVRPNFKIKRTFALPKFIGITHGLLSSRIVKDRKPDAVYTRLMWAAYWLSQSGIPVLYESHNFNYDKQQNVFSKFIRRVLDSSTLGIVTISQALAEEYFEIGVSQEKVFVLADGVDLHRFEPHLSKDKARGMLGLPIDRKFVGYVGHLYGEYGIGEIIEAAESLPNIFFLIVGGHPTDVKKYKEIITARNLKNVILTGFVNHNLVPQYLYASDVLLMPYTTRVRTVKYMSPLKMFEYMAANRPIIATDLTAIKEILQDREHAIFVKPGDADDLIRGIQEILENQDLANRIAGKAKEYAQDYSWNKRAQKIVEIFEIIKNNHA